MYNHLRRCMRSRLSHTVISFLLILVVSLGTALAGSSVCPSDCPECAVVHVCCEAMAENPEPATSKMADHFPERTDCSHEGICLDGFQPIDFSSANSSFEYDSVLIQSYLSFDIPLGFLGRAASQVLPHFSLEKYPPLYLRNCSFLI